MKYIRGFMMAWGMFCWIPCPYRQWREEDRYAQVGMLPLIGTCMGVVIGLVWWGLSAIEADPLISGGLLTGAWLLLTGFIHLDGFMDCSDAILPRHPKMEERVRILKDSHVGAFAVICLVLMVLVFASSMMTVSRSFCLFMASQFAMIVTLSRVGSGVSVLVCRPMGTSQYAGVTGKGRTGPVIAAVLTGAAVIAGVMVIAVGTGSSSTDTGIAVATSVPGGVYSMISSLITAAVTLLSSLLVGLFDRKKLGGMNGDISGHMITTSEMCGVAAMALLI